MLVIEENSSKMTCCMVCFVFVFIILVIAICWTNHDSFENFGNIIKYKHETMMNVFSGGKHYTSVSPDENILEKFDKLKKENKVALVAILAPWCGYCKKLKSSGTLTKISKKYPVLVIDDKHPQTEDLMHLLQAEGFPSLGIFGHGQLFPYKGERDTQTILSIMDKFEETSPPSNKDKLMKMLKKNKKTCMFFLADWCGHCKRLKESKVMEELSENGVNVIAIDDKNPLTSKMDIKGFPTIICWKGTKRHDYDGERETSAIMEFLNKM